MDTTIREQVTRFWKVFCEEKKNLESALLAHNYDEVKEIKHILSTYFEELCNCEIELNEEDGIFEMTFLPELEKSAQLICELCKAQAPGNVSNWIIHASLPPLSQKALSTVVRIKEVDYSADDFILLYDIDEEGRCFNLDIYCPAFAYIESNKAMEIAYYMLMLNIGEAAQEGYINQVNVVDQKEDDRPSCVLSSFYDFLLDVVDDKKWTHYNSPTSIYRVYQVEQDALENEIRKDMKVIFTLHSHLINEVLNEESRITSQFFDYGGEYGYIYYKHDNNSVNDSLVRQALEKSVHELLYPLGIARSIGGAIGLTYAYIDLAIFDKEAFAKALSKVNEKVDVKLEYISFI